MGVKTLKLGTAFCAISGAALLGYLTTQTPEVAAPAPEPVPATETIDQPPSPSQYVSPDERKRFAPHGVMDQRAVNYINNLDAAYQVPPKGREWPYVAGNSNLLPLMVGNRPNEAGEDTAQTSLSASEQRARIPFWQFWRRWETAGRPSDVCNFDQANYMEELVRVAALIDELREGGLTEDEWRFQSDCMNSLPMPETMRELDKAHMRELFDNDIWRAELQEKFSNWIPRDEWVTYGVAEQGFNQRQDAFQFLSDSIRAAYGFKPIPVYLIPLADHQLLMGQYNPTYHDGRPALLLNANASLAIIDEPQKALRVIAEEIKHSIDGDIALQLSAGKLQQDDPRFLHAAVIYMNHRPIGYARVQHKNVDGVLTTDTQSFYDYTHQYLERTAKDYAGSMMRLTLLAMNGEPMPWHTEEQPAEVTRQAAPNPSR